MRTLTSLLAWAKTRSRRAEVLAVQRSHPADNSGPAQAPAPADNFGAELVECSEQRHYTLFRRL